MAFAYLLPSTLGGPSARVKWRHDSVFSLWVYDLESGCPVGKTHTHTLLKDARPRGAGERWNSESINYSIFVKEKKNPRESMTKKNREKIQISKMMNERGAINTDLLQVKKNYKGMLYTLTCQPIR